MNRLRLPLVLALFLAALAPALRAFVYIEDMPAWPDGTVTLHLQLGTTPTYTDGTTPNTTAVEALQMWNPTMGRVQLSYFENSTTTKSRTNGVNNVFFDSAVYGAGFGDGVLAVTVSRWSGSAPIESDVVVNTAWNWDSFRGALRFDWYDLRRVLIHEFGHILGLGHPDASGQYQTAIMNSTYTEFEMPMEDDQRGVTERYGPGVREPAAPPRFTSHAWIGNVSNVEGHDYILAPWIVGTAPIAYQWYKDDVAIPGATDRELAFRPLRVTDSGTYLLKATNIAGTKLSNPWTLGPIAAAQAPMFNLHPTGREAEVSERITLSGDASSNAPVAYRWTRDDVPIPGATSKTLELAYALTTDSGTYRLIASTPGGTVTSNPAALTVTMPPPPGPVTVSGTTVTSGQTAVLSASVPDSRSTTYQWYRDGLPIPGETRQNLYVENATSAKAGEYYLVLTNPKGSSTSTTAVLEVTPPATTIANGWSRAVNHQTLACFLFNSPARIERFDLDSGQWMTPLTLAQGATTIASAGPHGLAVAFGRRLALVDPLTGAETPVAVLETDPLELAYHAGRLYFLGPGRLGNLSIAAPETVLWTAVNWRYESGLSIDPVHNRAFCANTSAVSAIDLGADGSMTFNSFVSTLGSYGTTPWTLVRPDGGVVFNSSVIVYSTLDLSFAGSLGYWVSSIAFDGDTSFVLWNGSITRYDAHLAATGTASPTAAAHHLAVGPGAVFAFSQPTASSPSPTWQKIGFHEFALPPEVPAASGPLADYAADAIVRDQQGDLLLYSRRHGHVFRWSIREQRYVGAIPMTGRPNQVHYLADPERLLLGYAGGSFRSRPLASDASEAPLLSRAYAGPLMLAMGRHFGLAESSVIYQLDFRTFDSDGRLLGSWRIPNDPHAMTWDETSRRVYLLYGTSLMALTIDMDGVPRSEATVTLTNNASARAPIRVSPDGRSLVLGSGERVDAETLTLTGNLPSPISDGAWIADRLFTLRNTQQGVAVERVDSPPSETVTTRTLPGRALGLFSRGTGRLVAVTEHGGRTHFTLLDADLNIRNHFEDTPDLTKVALTNLSTRAEVGTGDNIIIAGFVVTGSQSKRILVRAVGPELKRFGVSDTLADPVLTVISDGGPVAENDNWSTPDGDALKLAFREVFAFGLADNSLDSALVAQLAPGKYTAQVSGKEGGQGVALVEAYDLDADPGERRLINISTRAVVGIGDKVLIPGLAVEGTEPKRLLIRAVGPELTRFQVAGVLGDPQLKVVNAGEEIVAANDNWGEDNTEVTIAATTAAKAFRLTAGGRDAALVVTLAPGSYTVVVSGVGDTAGVALVEIYEVP